MKQRNASSMPPRVHVVGRQNSGKTTLIVELVRHLTSRGLRIGTIKHTHHHHELDVPGKDSYRHREAGASPVGIIAPAMNAMFWPATDAQDDESRYAEMLAMFRSCDLVLVEGHLAGEGVKIEVWRAANESPLLAASDETICAVVSDDDVCVPVPVWPRENIAATAEQLLQLAFGLRGGVQGWAAEAPNPAIPEDRTRPAAMA